MLSNALSGDVITVHVGWGLDFKALMAKAVTAAQAQLTQTFQTAVSNALGAWNAASPSPMGANDWEVAWGPQALVVAPVPLSYDIITGNAKFDAANAVAVFHSKTLGRYVVGIAATNYVSGYDWIVEDFTTNEVTAWAGALQVWNGKQNSTTPSSSVPCLSQGTFTGISNLLSMTDTVTTKQTLIAWLKSVTPAAGSTLTFTGHSLAGALSPTLAMACFDPNDGLLKGAAWSVGETMIYPTAGATPGNGPFADLVNGAGFGGTDGAQPWQKWNTDLFNNLDIVPRAWDPATMQALPQIYSAYYDKLTVDLLSALVNKAIDHASAGVATAGPYTSIKRAPLNGVTTADAANEFVYCYDVLLHALPEKEWLTLPEAAASQDKPTNQTKISWTDQLLFQHTTAYGRIILGKAPEPVG